MLSISSGWDIVSYLGLLLLLWTIVRFLTTTVFTLFTNFNVPQKVDPFINNVAFPVSYWTDRGARPYQEDRHHEMIVTIKYSKNDDKKNVSNSYSTSNGAVKSSGDQNLSRVNTIINSASKSGSVSSSPISNSTADSSSTCSYSMYGVFDGHGGAKAAQYCKDHLLQTLARDSELESDPHHAIHRSFFKVDADFSAKAKVQSLTDGTTAVIAIISDQRIIVGNAGDSRAVLVQRGGKAKDMSIDHRPDRKDEEKRIRKLGGKVIHWGRWRVEGILAVSRSIGDVSLQPYITCEPEIIDKEIEPQDEYLVIASDGIWDVMKNEDVAQLVLENSKDFLSIAKKLCSEAIIMGSSDNVTALVVDLKKRYPKSNGKEKSK